MYYKNKGNKPYFEPSKEIILRDGLIEIQETEFNQIVYELNNQIIADEQRIALIKAKAGEIIKSKYSIEWQLNHPRLDATYVNEYSWLDNIRKISNEAEANGTALEDIDWLI